MCSCTTYVVVLCFNEAAETQLGEKRRRGSSGTRKTKGKEERKKSLAWNMFLQHDLKPIRHNQLFVVSVVSVSQCRRDSRKGLYEDISHSVQAVLWSPGQGRDRGSAKTGQVEAMDCNTMCSVPTAPCALYLLCLDDFVVLRPYIKRAMLIQKCKTQKSKTGSTMLYSVQSVESTVHKKARVSWQGRCSSTTFISNPSAASWPLRLTTPSFAPAYWLPSLMIFVIFNYPFLCVAIPCFW